MPSVTIRRLDAVQLAGREKSALHAELDRLDDVGVVQNDLRVLAAHFQLAFFQRDGALLRNAATDGLRAGEADRVHARMVDERVANHAAPAHDQVEHAGRNAAAADDLGQRPGAARHQVGGLHHDAVAVSQCRRDFPGGNRNREIPRGDDADHANRLAGDFNADAGAYRRNDLAGQAQAFAGEELEDFAGAGGLADALGFRFAFFARQQRAEFLAPGQDFRADLVERIGPGLDAR